MSDIARMELKVKSMEKSLKTRTWSVDKIRDNDKATKFYTGLPTFGVFLWLFKWVQLYSNETRHACKHAVMTFHSSVNNVIVNNIVSFLPTYPI
jgi:hypothetical protein